MPVTSARTTVMASRTRTRQRGLSIVEFMVGVAIGLFLVAAATLMVSGQLTENRRLLLETQLQQDLRATADIMTRELRRSSYSPDAAANLWFDGKTTATSQNTFGALTPASGDNLTELSFKYRRRSGDEGPYGFKLDGTVIKSMIAGQWQTLTDANVMRITAFDIDLAAPVGFQLPCPRLCSDGTQNCWPTLQMRTATISLTGQSVSDASVTRTLRTSVKLRNDFTKFNGADICPA